MPRNFILVAALVLVFPANSIAQTSSEERIQYLSEQLSFGSEVSLAGATLASSHIIPRIYANRSFTPAWSDDDQIDEFIRLVGQAQEEGLDPTDYLYVEISGLLEEYRADRDNDVLRADVDVLLTESLSRYGYHLIYGKVDPTDLDENWNWSRSMGGRDPVALVQQAIDSESIETFIDNFLERGRIYERVKAILAEYRALKKQGGWPQVASGPTLRLGMNDERIPIVRERLAITGDLPASEAGGGGSFDESLQRGVEQFQYRHNLEQDGAIGPQTLAAMNVTVDERVDQIRVNLERIRWVVRDLENVLVITNIAAFRTVFVRDGELVWSERSQVGRYYRQTPVFKGQIKYLQFNPTWTVPPGILAKDILPQVQKDPSYLAKKNMDLIDRDGNTVDPASVDWSQYVAGRMPPYQFVQRPGPTNALGRVKFIFPNPHFVFLHDTPSKYLFERTERSFSSGCIRVENPFELAALLLDDPEKWNSATIQQILDSEKPQTVFLKEPITAMLLYSTVDVTDAEVVRFYRDIYLRDAPVLKSLDDDFEFRVPADAPASLQQ
jgi:murein L,D-transpeptidase YcbB/YkuD